MSVDLACNMPKLLLLLLTITLAITALALSACGGPTAPAGTRTINGQVVLPSGHQLDLSTFTVTTVLGSYPVTADGEFEAAVLEGDAS